MKSKVIDLVITIATWLAIFFAPAIEMIIAIGFFVMCDMVTAILAAKKTGEEINSKKMRPSIGKFVSYGIGILVAQVMQVQFMPEFPAMKLVAGLIAYIELKSINENIEKRTGLNLFKVVIEKLKVK